MCAWLYPTPMHLGRIHAHDRVHAHTLSPCARPCVQVINPSYTDKMFIVPWDSGSFIEGYGPPDSTPIGTQDAFYHLLQPHFKAIGARAPGYDLGALFQRWYGRGAPVAYSEIYTEYEMAASCWLPEGLLYTVPPPTRAILAAASLTAAAHPSPAGAQV